MADFDELRRLIDRFCRTDRYQTEVPGLLLIRSQATTASIPSIYAPIFCVAAQGRKRVIQGDALFEYGAGDYILASLDLPVRGEIFEASAEKPYLAASVGARHGDADRSAARIPGRDRNRPPGIGAGGERVDRRPAGSGDPPAAPARTAPATSRYWPR